MLLPVSQQLLYGTSLLLRPATNFTQTLTSASSASSSQTSLTSSSNPIAEYAEEQSLNPDIVSEISFLGEDGIDERDRTFVDYLVDIQHFDFSSHQKKYPSPDAERMGMQQELVNTILADRKISDTEYSALKFLHGHPTPMQPKLAKYDLDYRALELIARGADKKADPELVCELSRLPDISYNEEKYTEFFDKIIDISTDSRNKAGIEAMLNEGLQYGRRYCTPLQCLYWLWLDGKEVEGYLRPFSTARVALEAWQLTTTSRNYKSNQWAQFEKVTNRLSSGFLVSKYEQDNFSFDLSMGPVMEDAEYMFSRRSGVCTGYAAFAFVCLRKNGYDARSYYLEYVGTEENPQGHAVVTYNEGGKNFVLSNGERTEYKDLQSAFEEVAREQGHSLKLWAESTSVFDGYNGLDGI